MVPHEFLGIGWGELMLLLVLAVIFFGPEKLPEISRKAARLIYTVRVFANQATRQLKQELGPEYKDLTLADLNPKTFVQKILLADMQDDLNDIKKELDGVKTELTGSIGDMKSATSDVKSLVNANLSQAPAAEAAPAGVVVQTVPWDPEAT